MIYFIRYSWRILMRCWKVSTFLVSKSRWPRFFSEFRWDFQVYLINGMNTKNIENSLKLYNQKTWLWMAATWKGSCGSRNSIKITKGQLILKGLFGFFNSPKKRTKNSCPSRLGQKLTIPIFIDISIKTHQFVCIRQALNDF